MHLTSSPFTTRPAAQTPDSTSIDDQIFRTLMEVDAAVRDLLLAHLCDGDEQRRERLQATVEAALAWREQDEAPRRVDLSMA
ncbi:hypothetical protein [Actomonas aquatica]|uniref:Uncharacterized protein n=1 Tax=Actomonas aquatica TaxID=2866162 RepID=A0ABZ1C729_9BACT|nr:hypothetical protein [Opitutus sp. WL0086]WRQ87185.1 hypothetical protein K1X11_020425 [Opitutus sp. WL0086]